MKSDKSSAVVKPSIGYLPETGYVRQSHLIPGVIPISPATLWRKVKAGQFPQPVKLSERVTAWRVDDIRAWMQERELAMTKEGGHDGK